MGDLLHCNGVTVNSPTRISSVNGQLCWASGAFITIVDTTLENGLTQSEHILTKVN